MLLTDKVLLNQDNIIGYVIFFCCLFLHCTEIHKQMLHCVFLLTSTYFNDTIEFL